MQPESWGVNQLILGQGGGQTGQYRAGFVARVGASCSRKADGIRKEASTKAGAQWWCSGLGRWRQASTSPEGTQGHIR